VVVKGDLGCNIDLRELTDIRYDPRKLLAVIWQHRKIGGNALVFSNGKINCNGKSSSLQDGCSRLQRYGQILQKLGVTVSGAHRLSGRIDPQHLPPDFTYEPELFPAVMCRRAGLHFTCHLSGIMMITGIKEEKDIDEVNGIIIVLELLAYRENQDTDQWTKRTFVYCSPEGVLKYLRS
jgi:TATA-box binding protein (TBP) (component of TFIID and TFIIIB)